IVSIGSGKPPENELTIIFKSLMPTSVDTEDIAKDFHSHHARLFRENKAFRFNVSRGLGDITLYEYSQRAKIEDMTHDYLRGHHVADQMKECVRKLQPRKSKLNDE